MTDTITPPQPDAAPRPADPPRLAVTLNAHLSAAVTAAAEERGVTPEAMVNILLREKFPPPPIPRDDWERQLFAIGIDCGVSPPDSAFSSEELYP